MDFLPNESTRQRKFAKEIQRELSQLLQREIEPAVGAMITLSTVRVTPDLQQVRVYITCFPDNKLQLVLKLLEEENKKVRTLLAARIRNVVKVMPTLQFFEDDTLKNAQRLDQLFQEIGKPKPDTDEDEA